MALRVGRHKATCEGGSGRRKKSLDPKPATKKFLGNHLAHKPSSFWIAVLTIPKTSTSKDDPTNTKIIPSSK
jgi:hypothetical protein